MEEINHFSHEKHPLKLIENWEMVLGVDCKGCREPISILGGSVVYGCVECGFFLHKACTELAPTMNHHFHPLHQLTLKIHDWRWGCDVCGDRPILHGFSYKCVECDFDSCLKCAEQHSLKLIENSETVEGVGDDEGKQSVVACKGCRKPISISDGTVVYGCVECGYFLHKTCTKLAPTMNHHIHPLHPLTLILKDCKWSCDVCGDSGILHAFSYRCEGCDFDSCLKCAEQHSLKLIENWETVEGVGDDEGKQSVVDCKGCREPISISGGSVVYGCVECGFFLHKACTELAPTMNHHFHPLHPLTLKLHDWRWGCDVCGEILHGFSYRCEGCDFDSCLKCAEQHSLKLIENSETVEGVGDDEGKQSVVACKGCRKPISISGGSVVYGCVECGFFLHKTCSELVPTINHHIHPLHPLTLILEDCKWACDVCGDGDILHGFSYRCEGCDFDSCLKCAAAVVSKEDTSIKLKHKGHPQHMLTLQLRPASFLCDACHSEDKDFFYQCDSCDFWIHKTCASLAPTINLPHHPKHPLVLVHFLPENFYNFRFYCEFCNKIIIRNDWLYHCANCRYFAHIKCALNAPSPRDDQGTSIATEEHEKDLKHFPMSYSFTDPLKLKYSGNVILDDNETYEIRHWSHPDRLLILYEESQGNIKPNIDSGDLIEVCYGCVRPLSFPYYSCCEDGCSYTLHKYCAQLPQTLKHQLHPHHSLYLVDTWEDEDFYICTGCYSRGNTFAYKCDQTNCKFSLCANCAFLPNTIKHESHYHPLVQIIDPEPNCKACKKWSDGISYSCKDCDFQLGMHCAMRSPQSLTHRYCKGHEIQLTYPPVENHPEDFYCDICKEEMHPKFWLYHCHKCKSSFHLDCISRIDWYANIIGKGKETVSYHKHPLTYVRRQKGTPQYVCSLCNKDINGYLVLECRARLCNFNICFYCHQNKKW